MSILAMNWVWTLEDLGPSETLVLLALADAADDDGFCWPSQAFLARKSRQTDRNVRRILARLEKMGLLRVEARSSTYGRRSNLYHLNVGFSLEPRQEDKLSGCEEERLHEDAQAVDTVGVPATGQDVRLRKRTICPVAQPDTDVLPQPDTGVRLHIGRTTNKNHQTQPDQTCTSPVGSEAERSGRVGHEDGAGVGSGRAAPGPGPGLGQEDLALLGKCLPEAMLAMDPRGAAVVVGLLRERLASGWAPGQVRRVMDQRLPGRVGRMSSLVATRLERNVVPGLAPVAASEAGEGARREAARRRSEALAGTGRGRGGDPAFERALAEVAAEMPGADRVALARAAGERLRGRPAGVAL